MYKTLIALATLTTLTSCTFAPLPVTTPTPVTPAVQTTPDAMMQKETMPKDTMMSGSDAMMKDDKMMMSGSMNKTMMKDDAKMQKETPKMEASMKSHGYMDYTPELVASALKDGQQVSLFFAAAWCPSCRSLDKTIQADLGSINSDTLIVRVDYDNSAELKKKYGVVTQHTTVVLNTDGSEKSKKIGAKTVAEVVGK